MHELSIAVGIVDGVLEELRRHAATEAAAVYVRVGRLSGVDKDALQFSYQHRLPGDRAGAFAPDH